MSNSNKIRARKLEKVFRMCRKNRRGAVVVEFAVVAPVVLTLVLGWIDYGRRAEAQRCVEAAAREGVELAVREGGTIAMVAAAVEARLSSASLSGQIVTVNPNPPSSAGYGAPVTVTVSVPFSQVSWLPSPMFLSGKTLTASTVMRRETVR